MSRDRAVVEDGPTSRPVSRAARAPQGRSGSHGLAWVAIGRHDEVLDAERGAERGAGTVLVLGIVAAVLVLALGLGSLAHAQAARGAAQTGADLAALAAATALRDGWDPCGRAREVAARNAVAVTACAEQGGGAVRVDVATTTGVTVLGVAVGQATAAARAGPATAR
ncbi:Rv3654c family TadE-like protein [Cellulosimicrobium protaetiae]|uniref:Histidine kinase n=1 Tax=Cellulosimicrobium protaetiae TaxID=2587808 RepID=A0A6M5UJW4_9MICO|nr:Rv3654c family TadE-like protein [Cellulosimicrobium protaetiae]QJW37822.1 histidine kinase [Cellulosimicrobium protaetiae]